MVKRYPSPPPLLKDLGGGGLLVPLDRDSHTLIPRSLSTPYAYSLCVTQCSRPTWWDRRRSFLNAFIWLWEVISLQYARASSLWYFDSSRFLTSKHISPDAHTLYSKTLIHVRVIYMSHVFPFILLLSDWLPILFDTMSSLFQPFC